MKARCGILRGWVAQAARRRPATVWLITTELDDEVMTGVFASMRAMAESVRIDLVDEKEEAGSDWKYGPIPEVSDPDGVIDCARKVWYGCRITVEEVSVNG